MRQVIVGSSMRPTPRSLVDGCTCGAVALSIRSTRLIHLLAQKPRSVHSNARFVTVLQDTWRVCLAALVRDKDASRLNATVPLGARRPVTVEQVGLMYITVRNLDCPSALEDTTL